MEAARPLSRSRPGWSAANRGNRAARRELLDAIRAAAAPHLRGDGGLLDCGCGTGWLLEALAADGVSPRRLHGVDLDPERVAAAARRAPGATVRTADARSLPYPDGALAAVFHVVSLSSVGSEEAVREALVESRRVLAPGGVLAVYEPRLPNPFNRETRRVRRADFAAAGLALSEVRSLTLLPPLGRRLGGLTPRLHPRLSRLPALRSHRLLVHRAPAL
ncbi:MAG TPA: class I SAM-dependent methyltransferase [Solirubrobacterales bacterium]|nr:class I SAM-dependent methyltransferase [Solirubrobacterales bacterium]